MRQFGILQFHPILKRIRWGGRRLGTVLGKPIGNESDYAESWEVSAHENGPSVIHDGPHAGKTLRQLVAEFPEELLGRHHAPDGFPLLIKFLDAGEKLSVQVHPDDIQAAAFQPSARGKTESWVILEANPGSRLFVGLKSGVDADRLRAALNDGAVEDCLHSYPVQTGDCVFIPAGTVHAIGEGILLAEIQQSSDITFRLYDWGRVGTDGKPRKLHVEEALACIDFERGPVDPVRPALISEFQPRTERLVQSKYFITQRHTASEPFALERIESFRVLMTLAGAGAVSCGDDTRPLTKGVTVLIPACCERAEILPGDEALQILDVFVPSW